MHSMIRDSELRTMMDRIPCLAAVENIRVLNGGLTNKNYRIDTTSDSYVMRVSSGKGDLLGINRENERVNTLRAHQAGIGPEVIHSSPDEQILLLRWVEAETLHASDFHSQPGLLPRIAGALKALHTGPEFQGYFHFPAIRKKYLKTVLDSGYFMPDEYINLEPLISELEIRLAESPENLVPCNNDLLAENFLDDGKKIWIIDYEYAGQNEASFEIGNLAGETALDDGQLTALCDAYWEKHSLSKIARARAWSVIARFGWVLWASIQGAVSPIDFDFRSWGMRKWHSVLPELGGDRYQQILENLTI
ncbi:MAG: choline kinase family protein [Bacteroidota bacterium]|nr:choline kinase family protein [Bacteroidota bacterium]MDP4251106.1 choline kinase family protein [Bacteroidota bacterium]